MSDAGVPGTHNRPRGIIAALLTPMGNDGSSLDLGATSRLVAMLVDRGIHGLFIAGTTGEGLLLTREERRTLVEVVLEAAPGVPVMVHVGAMTTGVAAELAGHAARAGATAVAAIPPIYYPVTREELVAYYGAIGRAAAPIPVYLYNIPSHAQNDLTPEIVTELRRQLPNLAGIKDSSGDPSRLAALIRSAGPGFDVICGSDELGLAAFQAGAAGLVSSGAGIFPELYLALHAAWQSGRREEAEVAQGRIDAMQRVLGNGARLDWYKYAWALQGLPIGGVRPPLINPSPEEKEAIRAGLEALGLLRPARLQTG